MSLFGNPAPNFNPNPTPGTAFIGGINPGPHGINSLGQVGQNYRRRNNEGHWIDSINSIDPKISLDELRANDYFSLKKNLVPEATKTMIDDLRRANVVRRGQAQLPTAPGLQAPPQLLANSNYVATGGLGFGGNARGPFGGGLFPNAGGPGLFGGPGIGGPGPGGPLGGTGPGGPFGGTGPGGPFGGAGPGGPFGGAGPGEPFGGAGTGGPFGGTGPGGPFGGTGTGGPFGGTGPGGPFGGAGTGGPFGGTGPGGTFGATETGNNPFNTGLLGRTSTGEVFGGNNAFAGPGILTGTAGNQAGGVYTHQGSSFNDNKPAGTNILAIATNPAEESPKLARKNSKGPRGKSGEKKISRGGSRSRSRPRKNPAKPEDNKGGDSDNNHNVKSDARKTKKTPTKVAESSDDEEEEKTNVQSHIPKAANTKAHRSDRKKDNLEDQNDASASQTLRTLQSHSGTVTSAAGSYYHEMNKTVFIGGFLGLLEDHNMKFSDDILDSTDFVPKVFELLQNYGIRPPTEDVPKFLIRKNIVSSSTQGGKTKLRAGEPAKDEEEEEEEEKKTPTPKQTEKVIPKPKPTDKIKPKEDHEVEEKKIDIRSPEAKAEEKEHQTRSEGEGQKTEEEYERIEEAGVPVVRVTKKIPESTSKDDRAF